MLIFSTANAFHRELKPGALQLLEEAASSSQVKVRILVPVDPAINKVVDELKNQGIVIRDYKNPMQVTAATTLVVDQAYCLTVELQNSKEEEVSQEAVIELATYSNSQYTALSYVLIFETHWMQKEIYEKTKQQHQNRN